MLRSTVISALMCCASTEAFSQTTAGDCSPVIEGSTSVVINCGASNRIALPALAGRTYEAARILLMDAGWQPSLGHPNAGNTASRQAGNGPHLWRAGFHELVSCAGTSYVPCLFIFSNPDGEYLRVITQGEASEYSLRGVTVRGVQRITLEEARLVIEAANN